jgi:hypothetical protein
MVVKTTQTEHNFCRRFVGCENYKASSMFYDLGFQKFGQFVEHLISCLGWYGIFVVGSLFRVSRIWAIC